MGKALTFANVQRLEAAAKPARTVKRVNSDPAAIRCGLIASGVLRPANDGAPEPLRAGVYSIDHVGIADAARTIVASGLGPDRFAAVVEQADVRVAAKLREIAAARCVLLQEAA